MSEKQAPYTPVTIGIELETLKKIRAELHEALEPMVPYKRDPLEFANAAHDVKNGHVKKALAMLPLGVYGADPEPEQCMHGYYSATLCPDCTPAETQA